MLQHNIEVAVRLVASLTAFLLFSSPAVADVNVLVSIKPIHSLVAQVMRGIGEPGLIVDGSNSPHTYSLRPSNAADLQRATLIFWIGHDLEAFLEKPLQALASNAKVISLMDADGIMALPQRDTADFGESNVHDQHDHGDHDPHIWLAPENAKAILTTVAKTLSAADPANAKLYAANATKAAAEIDLLSQDIKTKLAKSAAQKFVVFHDAYQYFEAFAGIQASGVIAINPENPPGAETLRALRQKIASEKIECVFSEPQFNAKLVDVVIEGSTVRKSVLDPIGASLDSGPALYPELMRNLANNFATCLSQD